MQLSTTTTPSTPLVPSISPRFAQHKACGILETGTDSEQVCVPESPLTTEDSIHLATHADQKWLTAALVLAFVDDPIMRWMYPDTHQYLTHFPAFVKAFGGRAFEQQTAYAVNGYAGAAFWLPPGIEVDEQPLIDLFQHSVFEAQQADLFALLEQMGHYHPLQPHWYLSLLAVEPAHQRQGHGSALMQPILAQCDRDQLPAYVESSKPDNIPFYQRHGFELLGTIQAGGSPPLFPMLRPPNNFPIS
ncbi:GNAT family N-acetyltransferase [Leptolyngbya sp. CCNP1308]|uniref:GNAT family N-acetyltransferase n=1 Tax=Leptolyngbya sp. CCNP1308 TaxID=3110255 RepID=UPI002B1EDC0C|nr:GNAT family N-acetyltransferase [Leptolyngbya sp. CCNP1308]MEA5449580.1 GNAT family N-acetyltransferase [Leptolyngbya sp. CCNP1308]